MAFPFPTQGSFNPMSGATEIWYERARIIKTHRILPAIEPGDKAQKYSRKDSVMKVAFNGYILDQSEGTYPLATQTVLTMGTLVLTEGTWSLQKRWRLIEATEPGEGEAKWSWHDPVYTLRVTGWARDSGPLEATTTDNWTFNDPMMGVVTFATGMQIQQMMIDHQLNSGENVPVMVSGPCDGIISYTQDGDIDLSWLFIASGTLADNPVEGTVTNDLDAESISNNALLYDITIAGQISDGGEDNAITVKGEMIWQKA